MSGLMDPTARLERTLKLRVKGHQLVLLRWWAPIPPETAEREEEYGARPATLQEVQMWRRLVILEDASNYNAGRVGELSAALEKMTAERDDLVNELTAANRERRPEPQRAGGPSDPYGVRPNRG